MTYKILGVNMADGWVLIEITLPGGAIRRKRMMADTTSLDTIKAAVTAWWRQFLQDRQNNPAPPSQTPADIQAAITGATVLNP